jgi:hypothetical protein
MMQRPRWGDFVDSSDEESESEDAWSDVDTGTGVVWRGGMDVEPAVQQRIATTITKNVRMVAPGLRRAVIMPMFIKRASAVLSAKPYRTKETKRVRTFAATCLRQQSKRRMWNANYDGECRFVKTLAGVPIATCTTKQKAYEQSCSCFCFTLDTPDLQI